MITNSDEDPGEETLATLEESISGLKDPRVRLVMEEFLLRLLMKEREDAWDVEEDLDRRILAVEESLRRRNDPGRKWNARSTGFLNHARMEGE